MPLDLQAWLFGVGLHPEAVKLTSVAKATIYKYHLGLELGNASQHIDLPTLWERTLAVHRWRCLSRGKLAPYFTGPYTILEIISPNVVRIDRPNQPLQRDTDTVCIIFLQHKP
ncbi:hypothetical protein LAZ67_13000649 [Cordylochernes scorpioides]|uniref:Uncharacterized protein n=1 Tax=Cordylochernes scorpioides TaxID=51811 RepID=A0ABY6L342_9ARAC|nr:hypothetical protein LAZ67_13000649 [Cordylochernes scorpioides]